MQIVPLPLASLVVLLLAASACNSEPPQCPAISDTYVLTYRYLDGEYCPIGPYRLKVDGGSGVKSTTTTWQDVTIFTEVQLSGCRLSLDLTVTNNDTDATMSSVSGDLTVYDVSNISGVGNGVKYASGDSAECSGQFEITLEPPVEVTAQMPVAGSLAL